MFLVYTERNHVLSEKHQREQYITFVKRSFVAGSGSCLCEITFEGVSFGESLEVRYLRDLITTREFDHIFRASFSMIYESIMKQT